MGTIWPPSYGQAQFAAEAGGSSGMKIKYFGSVFLDQIMRYNTWLEKHFFSFSLKESSNTLTHKDYTANCSSSKLIVSKRSFSRNFLIIIRHLLYFFLIRFSQQVLLEESWRLLCRRFHSIGPWLCPIRDRFGFCCSSKPWESKRVQPKTRGSKSWH